METLDSFRVPLRWLPTELQLSDSLTKIMKDEVLIDFMDTGCLELPLVSNWTDFKAHLNPVKHHNQETC